MNEAGLTTIPSANGFTATVEKLVSELEARKITLFARIDHAAGAASVGLSLPPTTLLIFGNPQAGTPLMQAARTAAIDLPLKILVWEDEAGKVQVSYNEPGWIAARHGVSDLSGSNLPGLTTVLQALARLNSSSHGLAHSREGFIALGACPTGR